MAGRIRTHAARRLRNARRSLMYLLDANVWIAIFRQKSDALLNELKRRSPAEIVLCSVVLSELWYGVCRSPSEHCAKNQHLVEDVQARYVSVPLDDAAALNAAEVRGAPGRERSGNRPLRRVDRRNRSNSRANSGYAQCRRVLTSPRARDRRLAEHLDLGRERSAITNWPRPWARPVGVKRRTEGARCHGRFDDGRGIR